MAIQAITEIPGDFGEGGGSGGAGGGNTGRAGPAMNALRVFDPDSRERAQNLDYEIRWSYIEKSILPGKIHPTAKKGEVDSQMGGQITAYDLGQDVVYASSALVLRKQLSPTQYEQLEIFGLQFTNWVYQGKSVIINAHDAFFKKDEEGFLIPLNQQVLNTMSLRDVTQLGYDCTHMVLNSYQIVKKKWYQKGIFKVLLIIVAIVLVVLFPPAGFGTLTASIAGATGLVVTSLLVKFIAATLTVLASMVLSNLLTPVLIEAFGEKWGRVLAIIASAVAMNIASGSSALGNLSKLPLNANTIIQGTTAVLKLANAYQQGAMVELDVAGQMKKMTDEYELKMDELEKKTAEFLGPGTNLLDIQGLIDATTLAMEGPTDFLARTLLTGSDIAAITTGQIENFADVGLQLPNTG